MLCKNFAENQALRKLLLGIHYFSSVFFSNFVRNKSLEICYTQGAQLNEWIYLILKFEGQLNENIKRGGGQNQNLLHAAVPRVRGTECAWSIWQHGLHDVSRAMQKWLLPWKLCGLLNISVLLQHDNARVAIKDMCFDCLPHPPY